MSLLMDALKKAEAAKRGAEVDVAPPVADLALEPRDSAQASRPTLRAPQVTAATTGETAARLAMIEEDLGEPVSRNASPAAKEPDAEQLERERQAAQNLFAAKPAARPEQSFVLYVGAIALVAAIAIGGYFWYQLSAPPAVLRASPVANPPPVAANSAAQRLEPPAGLAPKLAEPRSTESMSAAPRTSAGQGSSPIAGTAPLFSPPMAGAAVNVSPEVSPIRITRPSARIEPGVAQAYQNLVAGNLAGAGTSYANVLQTEPNNSNALHGLAAVSIGQGRLADAQDYYRRAVIADPKDAAAQAGLISLDAESDPARVEGELRQLLAEQPETAAAYFALGNLYAKGGRWREAQEAYFNALATDSGNPDYHFNLAVSLDHLRQPGVAIQYYRSALETAKQRPAGFDKAAVAARLRELQQ